MTDMQHTAQTLKPLSLTDLNALLTSLGKFISDADIHAMKASTATKKASLQAEAKALRSSKNKVVAEIHRRTIDIHNELQKGGDG